MRHVLNTDDSLVVLIDYQPRLMAAIHQGARVTAEAVRLASVAAELGVPVLGTQQNPSRLGPLDPDLAGACRAVLDKLHFDACGQELLDEIGPEPRDLVVAGCESHVCLLQTALSLLDAGHRVWVCEDACGSRSPASHEVAMRRLEQAGAVPASVEMVAFEWLGHAGHPSFKAVQTLIK